MPRDNGFDGTYMRREKQKKEKAVKTSKTTSEKVCWLSDRDNCEIIVKYAERAKEVRVTWPRTGG